MPRKTIPKVVVCLRLKSTTNEKLEQIANNEEETKTDIIRKILEKYVKNYEL